MNDKFLTMKSVMKKGSQLLGKEDEKREKVCYFVVHERAKEVESLRKVYFF